MAVHPRESSPKYRNPSQVSRFSSPLHLMYNEDDVEEWSSDHLDPTLHNDVVA